MTGDAAKATEITQDVFVWLIHHPDGFDPKRGELGAFLTGVTRKHVQRRWQQDRRWVPFEEGRCSDCDDNGLEPTKKSELFPTGQAFPPAHPGCRCLLAPANLLNTSTVS